MSCLRVILAIFFPPLAVIDRGCGSVLIVFLLTLCGWVPGVIGALVIGAIIGFFGARKLIKREMEKHPPIDEKAIRAMFMAMGRKPSEAQIRQVMKSMKQNNNL